MINFIENSLFFGAALSLAGYEVGLLLKKKFKMALFNPLLIAILCVMGMLQLMQVDYKTYNAGGQYISYLLTPATVCLAVPLYRQLTLLRKNLKAVVIGIVSGVLASMVSVLIFAKLFGLSHSEYVTLLPKSITTSPPSSSDTPIPLLQPLEWVYRKNLADLLRSRLQLLLSLVCWEM